ncbi:Rpr2-domain-containing protein [Suhomyces tanzawaensis NRRL Y-17324]|uniref:Rpr2-domain-containing protein n=1 Tax=Suhomyces tanzawaensis NRRL Y-17324 TaxID=984487 RepID=A0A1E4SKG8_9ASCO|nr:Rpr2-domain-containing protein [Suhomyces tanzawaensis NRRL Y-17324]ODV80006.1 Rpr2-domain-containing protein [Suhomyces tanzawaensis NRRL Y-17324]
MKVSKAPKSVPHKDHYARISYLFQASSHLALNPQYDVLSRHYARTLDLVAKKTVLKLTPALKRQLCKKCNTFLIPGLTVKIHIENLSKAKSLRNDVLVNECLECGEKKRFPVGQQRDYVLFSEKEDVKIPAL